MTPGFDFFRFHIIGKREDRKFDVDFIHLVQSHGIEASIFESCGLRTVCDYVNQRDVGSELSDAAPQPAPQAQGDEGSAGLGGIFGKFLVVGKMNIFEELAALNSQGQGASGNVQKQPLFAVSD